MPTLRGIALACAIACAVLLGLAGTAGATSALDIYTDYAEEGVIDGRYRTSDLLDALRRARDDAQYASFADAVQAALDAKILGARPGDGGDDDDDAGGAAGFLPEPRNPDERGQPPWPFLALTALAGLLVVGGAGSSIYRRARR